MTVHTPLDASCWNDSTARKLIEARRDEPGAMLPILHDLQQEFGYIDQIAVPVIAETLNVSRAEVHGVISYYHDFRHAPAGRHVLKICRAEACHSMGCHDLIDHVERAHGLRLGATAPDGSITVEEVFCLGNCALSPAVLLNGELIGRVTPADLDAIVETAARGL
jgi:formate dehydrogenase subunit gamma